MLPRQQQQQPYYTTWADKYNHLYTLIIRPDNSFEIKIDGVSEKTGSLLEDLTPPINPPKVWRAGTPPRAAQPHIPP